MSVRAEAPTRSAEIDRPAVSTAVAVTIRAVVVALVATILIHTIAQVAGVTFVLRPPGSAPVDIPIASVALMTVGPLIVGGVVLALALQFAVGFARSLAWIGLVIGVGTVMMPLSMGGDLSTRLALASMHVVVGLAWFASVRRARI